MIATTAVRLHQHAHFCILASSQKCFESKIWPPKLARLIYKCYCTIHTYKYLRATLHTEWTLNNEHWTQLNLHIIGYHYYYYYLIFRGGTTVGCFDWSQYFNLVWTYATYIVNNMHRVTGMLSKLTCIDNKNLRKPVYVTEM